MQLPRQNCPYYSDRFFADFPAIRQDERQTADEGGIERHHGKGGLFSFTGGLE